MASKTDSSAAGKSKHVKEEVVMSGKWLSLNKITYTNSMGAEKFWESAARTTRNDSDVDAIAVIAILRRTLHYDCVVLVKQYRPTVRKYTLEFPAGLVDSGETLEKAALRELKEETGYTAVCKHTSPATSLDAGLENCTLALITAEVDGDLQENLHPKQCLEETEEIEIIKIPMNELLDGLNAYAREDIMIDSRVYSYAIALTQATKQKEQEIRELTATDP